MPANNDELICTVLPPGKAFFDDLADELLQRHRNLIETGDYDLSGLMGITNGGAPLSPTVRDRLLAALKQEFPQRDLESELKRLQREAEKPASSR